MKQFDTVVVGGGPSGLFVTLELARAGVRVCLVEKGGDIVESLCPKMRAVLASRPVRDAERFRQQCGRCNCLEGLGGAAFHFDTNLGYPHGLSRAKIERSESGAIEKYSHLERTLGSFERADESIRDVYKALYGFGLPRVLHRESPELITEKAELFAHVDVAGSQVVTVENAIKLITAIRGEIEARGGEVHLHTMVRSIDRAPTGSFRVEVEHAGGAKEIGAESVVLAVGKPALRWLESVITHLGIAVRPSARVDLGVRLETFRSDLQSMVAACQNPKLSFINGRDEPVRTFCVCDGGRIMQYQFAGVTVLDGQHCIEHPTEWSNLGVVASENVPDGRSGTRLALEYAERVNRAGQGRPVVQAVGELFDVPATRGDRRRLNTSLVEHTKGDLRECLPPHHISNLREMVQRLNALFPGCVQPDAVFAAPVVERLGPDVELTHDLETSVEGLFLVGDCSAKIIGITYGAATGIAAARAIRRRFDSKKRAS